MSRTFLFIFLSFSAVVHGATPQQEFNQSFASAHFEMAEDTPEKMEILPGRMPGWVRWLFAHVLDKEANTSPKTFSVGCSPQEFEQVLRNLSSASQQAKAIHDHFEKCRSEIETGVNSEFRNILELWGLKWPIQEHPFLQRVNVKLPGGVLLPGLLALKGDRAKRPFVVLRLGIFGNVSDFIAERFLLMQIFEQGPANVLVLENSTGTNFQMENTGVTIGGAFETLQNLQVAKMLRSSEEPLSNLISSLHFVGISMGASGMFGAAALDPLQPGGPRIESFTAFCPVVHFKKTMEAQNHSWLQPFYNFWFTFRYAGMQKKNKSMSASDFTLKRILEHAEEYYSQAVGPQSEGLLIPLDWPKNYYEASEPWAWFKDLKAPFLTVATKKDGIVPTDLNIEALQEILRTANTNAGAVIVDQGFHCTLTSAYDWNTISAIVNASVVSTDRKWKTEEKHMDLELDNGPEDSVVMSREFFWPEGDTKVGLRLKLMRGASTYESVVTIPLKDLDFSIHGEVSPALRRMLENWMNFNLRNEVIRENGKRILRVRWPKTMGPAK